MSATSLDPSSTATHELDVGALPRLLAGIPAHGTVSFDEHIVIHGHLPSVSRRGRRREAPLIEQIEHAGLHGRGGASFATATKLRAVAASRKRSRHAIVVVNAVEGEPASLKDRTLMQTLPHLVFDGAHLAAQAVGADDVIVCVCESARDSITASSRAITERQQRAATDFARMHMATIPNTYVAGQETALIHHLNGGPAVPTFTPPMPFEQGVRRRPTLVLNAETFAHVALIARHGPAWFRRLGTHSQPGSALVTVSGALAHPGVYEIEHGVSLAALIDAAGGVTSDPQGLLVGGYSGSWIGHELLRGVALSDEHLAPLGARLGAGVVLLLSADACPVTEVARVTRWLAGESAGQCGPCVYGLHSIATTLAQLAAGHPQRDAPQRIAQLTRLVDGRGACGHPDGAARFVYSALEAFGPEFAEHARHGPCEGCVRPGELPLPTHHVTATPDREPELARR